MDIKIRPTNEENDFDEEMSDLMDALVKALGDSLPDVFEGITEKPDRYDLHLASEGLGNAYGETLVTHGWAIIGLHTHYSESDEIDTISVRRIDECDSYDTIMYSHGDEERVTFEENR